MRPRDLVMAHLRAVGEVTDPGGRASATLAEAVGYPGTSLAFAQLLHGMEQSGLIEREVRGKRTYRIAPAAPAAPEHARDSDGAIDYDELARRLLVQVIRRVASVEERQRRLRTENERLRELLGAVRQDLADQRSLTAGDAGAGQLLERLLTSLRDDDSPGQSA